MEIARNRVKKCCQSQSQPKKGWNPPALLFLVNRPNFDAAASTFDKDLKVVRQGAKRNEAILSSKDVSPG